MSKKPLPTIEMLHKLLICDAVAGKLFWRERAPDMFSDAHLGRNANAKRWNTRFAGKEAFTALTSSGYLRGTIFGKSYRKQRVIWAMVTDKWPVNQIDHEDHDRANNRFVNLREATNAENHKNMGISKSNKSGVVGVSWCFKMSKWRAQIGVNSKSIHLGSFFNLRDAVAAREAANIEYGFHENHGK